MTPDSVRAQVEDVLNRLIGTSLSVRQFHPTVKKGVGGSVTIGRPQSSPMALKDVSYDEIYRDMDVNEAYDVKMIDGGLLIFQYRFNGEPKLIKHRLAYFPNPIMPTIDEAPALYEEDELYGDIVAKRLVRFPIRFDYAPDDYVDSSHPASHLTLGQYEGCRIPVSGPVGPSSFVSFVVRNFYCRAYKRHKNIFDKNPPPLSKITSISTNELRMTHFVHGR
ncbi:MULTISPECIES: DUF2290 domain-containing protein [Xanthomonas]|uniref:DUF2290 domain-containing protein n=1 Tax=Xanthomonas cucurbitae TaxID=56453 RepID=A0ABY7YF22_9XANT|nr:DUF2290 domain-containing protein [Xanthomonas cucurbitae]QHG86355.1 DUF2290 domain-containing protein [Xanthomonas cucurbitae]WDM68608.1 DUF2290 domain-containing protein [Xanthomonas cucurbitae]WDM72482.1 DUF2290 domain-containing protein [Xanthomonas cucurbitae]WDM76272.1 DUF2290 domain-containing protein [Xanthomonas cucurbitae]